MTVRKVFVALVVGCAGMGVLAAQPAVAATAPQASSVSYKADLRGLYAPVSGTATLTKFNNPNNPGQWGAQVGVRGLPTGDYRYIIGMPVDTNHDGVIDGNPAIPVCSFHSIGDGSVSGCGAAVTLPKGAVPGKAVAYVNDPQTDVAIGDFNRVR